MQHPPLPMISATPRDMPVHLPPLSLPRNLHQRAPQIAHTLSSSASSISSSSSSASSSLFASSIPPSSASSHRSGSAESPSYVIPPTGHFPTCRLCRRLTAYLAHRRMRIYSRCRRHCSSPVCRHWALDLEAQASPALKTVQKSTQLRAGQRHMLPQHVSIAKGPTWRAMVSLVLLSVQRDL